MSLTCEASENGTERWWLTGESGRAPICWWEEPQAGRSCGGSLTQVPRKSYLVLKAALGTCGAMITPRWKYVAIAELTRGSLQTVIGQLVRTLRRLPTAAQDCTGRGEALQELFGRLDAGLFSLPRHSCHCAATSGMLCPGCRNLGASARRFVVQASFLGCYPRGPEHWLTGVTDAVGDIAHLQLPWLQCCCGTTLRTCIIQ